MMVQAQSVKIVLPERFRVLSDQLFDLRVEVTGLSSLDAQIQLVCSGELCSESYFRGLWIGRYVYRA